MFTVSEQIYETPSIKTVRFKERLAATPGQFVMVWVPGVDEFPMSVSHTEDGLGITYQILGDGTRALASKAKDERIGIRGPYGKGFAIHGKQLLIVAGGAGMAPLAPFVEEAVAHRASVDLVLGARTSRDILFESRSVKAGARVRVSTDDGSKGFKGLASELAESVLSEKKFDSIYACGPEKMLVGILKTADSRKVPLQVSLERIMKCGIGICDSCAIDGKHVCRDGPVFSERELRTFEELGKTKLDMCGRKVPV